MTEHEHEQPFVGAIRSDICKGDIIRYKATEEIHINCYSYEAMRNILLTYNDTFLIVDAHRGFDRNTDIDSLYVLLLYNGELLETNNAHIDDLFLENRVEVLHEHN